MAFTEWAQISGIERDDDIACSTVESTTACTVETTYNALGGDRCIKLPMNTAGAKARVFPQHQAASFGVDAIHMFSLDVGGGATTSEAIIIGSQPSAGSSTGFIKLGNSPRILNIYDGGGTLRLSSKSTWSTSALTRYWVMFDFTTTTNTKLAIWNYKGDLEAYVATGISRLTFIAGGSIVGFGEWLGGGVGRGADLYGGVIYEYSLSAGDSPLYTPYPVLKVAGGGQLPPTAVGGFDDTVTATSGTATAATTGPPGTLTDGGASWTVDAYIGALVTAGGKTMTVASNTATKLTGTGGWSGGGNPGAVAYTVKWGWTGTMTGATGASKYQNLDDLGAPGSHPGHDSATTNCGIAAGGDYYGNLQTFTYSAANPMTASHTIRFVELGATMKAAGLSKVQANGLLYDGTNKQIFTWFQPSTAYAGTKESTNVNPAGNAWTYTDFALSGGVSTLQFGGRGLTVSEAGGAQIGGNITDLPGPVIVFSDKGAYLKTINAQPIYIA